METKEDVAEEAFRHLGLIETEGKKASWKRDKSAPKFTQAFEADTKNYHILALKFEMESLTGFRGIATYKISPIVIMLPPLLCKILFDIALASQN